MVEKIKRDVRITTIYEGTSEIMEMTIARDRWQTHLKTRGQHYHDDATRLRELATSSPGVGADVAALAADGLGHLLERARVGRLTRNQHLLFRLGALIARVEAAGALARRAAAAANGGLPEKADHRLDQESLALASRVYAREAAHAVASEGLRWVVGADGVPSTELAAFEASLGAAAIRASQAGLVADMDRLAQRLYQRYQG